MEELIEKVARELKYHEARLNDIVSQELTTEGYIIKEKHNRLGTAKQIIPIVAEAERERIHDYIEIISQIGDLKVNDGSLLWDIIQDTLPLKYIEVGLVRKIALKSRYGKGVKG